MAETLRNLREIAPTVYFNVPTGFEAIANAMKTDDAAAPATCCRACSMFFYAGAALSQPVWDSLHRTQEAEIGERIVMGTGLGMTESAPFAHLHHQPERAVPATSACRRPGMELKLVDVDGKTEVRYRGPNVTPGYWRAPEATRRGLRRGRLLLHRRRGAAGSTRPTSTAACASTAASPRTSSSPPAPSSASGPLRAKIIAAGAPYVQDAVLTGINLKEVGALIFPTQAVRKLAGLPADAPLQRGARQRAGAGALPAAARHARRQQHRQRQPHRARRT